MLTGAGFSGAALRSFRDGGAPFGMHIAEMQLEATRGELEGWRLVAKEAEMEKARLEDELRLANIEVKALRGRLTESGSQNGSRRGSVDAGAPDGGALAARSTAAAGGYTRGAAGRR